MKPIDIDDITTVAATLGSTYSMGAGDDTVTVAVATLVADGTDDTVLSGGGDTDELRISDNGATMTDNHFTNVTGFEELTFEDGSTDLTTGAAFKTAFADGVTITNAAVADTETFTLNGGLYDKAAVIEVTAAGAADAGGEDITITTGSGSDTVTVTAANWVGEAVAAGDMIVATGAGNDEINFTTGTLAGDSVGVVQITGGAGKDLIEREGGANGDDTAVAYVTYSVTTEGHSLTTDYDEITGFEIGDATDSSDLLDFDDGAIADGLTSVDFDVIKSHSMTDGVVSFDDADTYGTALVIDEDNLADVVGGVFLSQPNRCKSKSRMLKAQYDLIPHKDDPFRYKELKARGLVDENGFVAMGVQNALALIKAEEEKPKWQRKVIDFSRYLKKKLGE